jgi:hypothetical protein
MLFPDSISTEELSELLRIKTAFHLRLEQKERMVDEWAKVLGAKKNEGRKNRNIASPMDEKSTGGCSLF